MNQIITPPPPKINLNHPSNIPIYLLLALLVFSIYNLFFQKNFLQNTYYQLTHPRADSQTQPTPSPYPPSTYAEKKQFLVSCYHADYLGFLDHMNNTKCPWNTSQTGTDTAYCPQPTDCVYQSQCYALNEELDIYLNDIAFGRAKCANFQSSSTSIWRECANPDLNRSSPGHISSTVPCQGKFENGNYDLSEPRFKLVNPVCTHEQSAYQNQKIFATWQNNEEHPIQLAFDNNPDTYYMACGANCPNPAYTRGEIIYDLGAIQLLSQINIQFGSSPHSYPGIPPCSYSILISSDQINWKTIHTRNNNCIPGNKETRSPDLFLPLYQESARYIKLSYNAVGDGTGWCVAIKEFTVN